LMCYEECSEHYVLVSIW